MDFGAMLEAGRRDFHEAVRGVTEEHANTRPSPAGWTVLECVEHVVATEARSLQHIAGGRPVTPRRNSRRESAVATAIRNRLTRVESPEGLRPAGRFRALAAALAEFDAVRSRSIDFASEQGERLYSMAARHPFLGTLNGAEWMYIIDGHARRHTEQILEVREAIASLAKTL